MDAETRRAALRFLERLAAELSAGAVDLPCFPDVVVRIRNALADPDTTPEETVIMVGAEPRLAARLLQTASSVAFNPSGKPLTELRSAITRLGHQLVQSAAMSYAVQQIKEEASLRSIAKPLSELWNDSIAVASICQVVARRTKVQPDAAFLTGLLHGIGRLYIMVRAVGHAGRLNEDQSFLELVSGWHASIGKAVLENWGFAPDISDAIGEQEENEPKRRREANLSDVLITSIALAKALKMPEPRVVNIGAAASDNIVLSQSDCTQILKHAEYQLASLHEALGC
jgi:HD-like signal output (HDOD) protein